MKKGLKNSVVLSTVFAAILFFAGYGFAADEYKIDNTHSTLGFSVQHLMVSHVTGSFDQYEGMIVFDPNDLASSKIDVTIQTVSINQHWFVDFQNKFSDKLLC